MAMSLKAIMVALDRKNYLFVGSGAMDIPGHADRTFRGQPTANARRLQPDRHGEAQ
jgi:hypothetical protein